MSLRNLIINPSKEYKGKQKQITQLKIEGNIFGIAIFEMRMIINIVKIISYSNV